MTSTAGTSASSIIARRGVAVLQAPERSTTNADSARTSSTLPSSEGWKRKNGKSIQRLDPRVAAPSASTSRIEPIMKP